MSLVSYDDYSVGKLELYYCIVVCENKRVYLYYVLGYSFGYYI